MEDNNRNIIQTFQEAIKDQSGLTEKQKRIMEASIQLFYEKGFNGVSTSEIAKTAGVSEGSIFKLFKTKKDILISLVAPVVIQLASPLLTQGVKRIFEMDWSVEEVLRELYQDRLSLVKKHWMQIRLIIQELQFHPELREAVVKNIVQILRNFAENFIEKKVESGDFRPLPPYSILRAMVSMMVGYVFFNFVMFPEEGERLDDTHEIDMMIDILLYGIKKE